MQPKPEYTITKEEHHWTSNEKLKFCGYGEWVEEADVVHLEYLGYEALIMQVLKREPFAKELAYFGGYLCGYIRIPDGHPWHGKNFMNIAIDIDCHGGITFNEAHEQHWIGFDCSHMGDLVPTMNQLRIHLPEIRIMVEIREHRGVMGLFDPVYRNMEFCIQECVSIIDQIIQADSTMVSRLLKDMRPVDEKKPG